MAVLMSVTVGVTVGHAVSKCASAQVQIEEAEPNTRFPQPVYLALVIVDHLLQVNAQQRHLRNILGERRKALEVGLEVVHCRRLLSFQ